MSRISQSHACLGRFVCLLLLLPLAAEAESGPGLDRHSKLVIANDLSYPPDVFLAPDGTPRGINVDLWRLWSRKTGVEVEFALGPWEEALASVREGRADVVGGLFRTPERELVFDFTGSFDTVRTSLFFHQSVTGLASIDDLDGFRLGVVRSDSAEEWLRSQHPHLTLRTYAGAEDLVRAAVAGEVKAFVSDANVARFYLAKHDEAGAFREVATPLTESLLVAAVRKGDARTLALVQDGLDRITADEKREIVERWTGVPIGRQVPWGIVGGVGGGLATLLLLLFLMNLHLNRRIARATGEIRRRSEEVERSAARFRKLLELAPVPMAAVSSTGQILEVNRSFTELFGYTQTDVPTIEHWWPLAYPDPAYRAAAREKWAEAVRRAAGNNGAVEPTEYEVTTRSGAPRSILISATSLGEEVLTCFFDLTERRRAEETVARRAAEVATLFHSAPVGIVYVRGGRVEKANDAACAMLVEAPAELHGRSLDRLAGSAAARAHLARVAADPGAPSDGAAQPIELSRRDGRPLHVQLRSSPFVLEGEEVGAILTLVDVTAARDADARLRRLALAIEQAAEEFIVTDTNGIIEYVNPAFERITGYSRDEVIGRTPAVMKSGLHGRDFYAELWRTIRAGQIWKGQITNRTKGGALIVEEATISPVMDAEGKNLGFIGVKRDMTEQLQLEQDLRQAQKMESIGTLAGGIAHDFNNILSAVGGFTEMALEGVEPGSPPHADLLQVRRATERATALVRQILTFSRKQVVEKSPLRPGVVVREALTLLRASLPATISIDEALDDECVVEADPTQLHQVVMNLGTNAWQAMPDGGALTVRLEALEVDRAGSAPDLGLPPGARLVRLSVSDTGCGIGRETLERIFEPYFTTREKGRGSGLGLATVHGIVKEHRGHVRVSSELGRGSTFEVWLPEGTAGGATVAVPAGKGEVARPGPARRRRIAVVDDEPQLRELHKALLERAGHEVVTFPDGAAAWAALAVADAPWDLVVTDQTMPVMTGDELTRRALEARPQLAVILCSGFSDRLDEQQALALGARAFLQKPFQSAELLRAVEEALTARVD